MFIYSLTLTIIFIPIQLNEVAMPIGQILSGLIFSLPLNILSLLPLLAIERFFLPIFMGWNNHSLRRCIGLGLYLFTLLVFFEKNKEARAALESFWRVYEYNNYLIIIPFLSYFIIAYLVENARPPSPKSDDILDDET